MDFVFCELVTFDFCRGVGHADGSALAEDCFALREYWRAVDDGFDFGNFGDAGENSWCNGEFGRIHAVLHISIIAQELRRELCRID